MLSSELTKFIREAEDTEENGFKAIELAFELTMYLVLLELGDSSRSSPHGQRLAQHVRMYSQAPLAAALGPERGTCGLCDGPID